MAASLLDREEYIEQAYFFRVYRERLEADTPSQEILSDLREEILAHTKLPLAIDFLAGEIKHTGRLSDGMSLLGHYFSPFQAFVMSKAEADRSKFDQTIALAILQRLAEYLSESPSPAGLFVYQFECIARNRLGYDKGMEAMSKDPFFDADWSHWIAKSRFELGTVEFADLLYARSEQFVIERRRAKQDETWTPKSPVFFGTQEGRIAKANRGKDPLYLFAALQRQLDYPAVPRSTPQQDKPVIHPVLQERLKQMEQRIRILELETQDKLDLSQFYEAPDGSGESTPHQ